MSEFISIAKAIQQTLDECISKIESIDEQVQKLKEVYENIKWKEFQSKIISRDYMNDIETLNARKADTLYDLNQAFVDIIAVIEDLKHDIEEKPSTKQTSKKEQKKPETKEQPKEQPKKEQQKPKEETKKPETKEQPKKEQQKPKEETKKPEPKKESDYDYFDEEESEASDFDEKEKQAKEAQQKKSEPKKQPEPEPKKDAEPTLTQIQQKNEAFFQDVMRVLTDFTTKLESMLREHLNIKKKEDEPIDDSTISSDSTIDTISDDDN